MAKKQKTTTAEVTEPVATGWPSATEKRQLPVKLNPEQLREKSEEMARATQDKCRLVDQKKSAASQYKASIDAKESIINELAQAITDGAEHKQVNCSWAFEQAGFDSDGAPVFHPEKKTLVRLDDNTAVEVRSITDEDRQMKLKLEDDVVATVGAEAEGFRTTDGDAGPPAADPRNVGDLIPFGEPETQSAE